MTSLPGVWILRLPFRDTVCFVSLRSIYCVQTVFNLLRRETRGVNESFSESVGNATFMAAESGVGVLEKNCTWLPFW